MQIPLEDKSKIKIQTYEISPNSKYKALKRFLYEKIDLKSPIHKFTYITNFKYINNKS